MVKRSLSLLVVLSMVFLGTPLSAAALKVRQNNGQIAGKAVVEGKPLPNITVRLRNTDTGQLAATTRTNDNGEFNFNALPAGNYVVETIAPNGSTLLGTSPRIALTAGAMTATGLTISTSAAAAAAAGLTGAGAGGVGAGAAGGVGGAGGAGGAGGVGGAGGAGAAGAGGAGAGAAGAAGAGGAFFGTTAGILTAVGIGGGVTAAVIAVKHNASPSR